MKIQDYENWVSDEICVKSRCAEQPSVRCGEKLTLCCFLPRWSRVSIHWWKLRVHSDAEMTWETTQRHPHGSWDAGFGGSSMPYSHLLPSSLLCDWGPLVWRPWSLWVPQLPWHSLAQRVSSSYELDTSVTNTISIHSLTNYILNVLLGLQDIGDKTRNTLLSWVLWSVGRSCYSQPCRGEEA